MKFLVNTKTLSEKLSLTERIIPKNPMIPVLENFLFEVSNSNLKVTASDLQITCITSLTIEAKEQGKMAIPAHLFLKTLQELPEEIITVSFDEESYNVEIQATKGRYKLSSENPADFPAEPAVEGSTQTSLPSEVLREAIARSAYAMSRDELRPAMNGLLIKLDSNSVTFVGTDGHRLVTYTKTGLAYDSNPTSIIVPGKSVEMLRTILQKTHDDEVKLQFNSSQALFEIGNVRIICRLIDETFPDYEKVIPQDNKNHITLDKNETLASLRRISIYANKSTKQMRLKVKGEQAVLTVEDRDFSNEATENIACTHDGEDIEIGFNVDFLREAFQNIEEDQVRIEMSDPNRAALVLPTQPTTICQAENLALVMPIMLQ